MKNVTTRLNTVKVNLFNTFSIRSAFHGASYFVLQLREQNHISNTFLAGKHHAQAVNAGAARQGHGVFEGTPNRGESQRDSILQPSVARAAP